MDIAEAFFREVAERIGPEKFAQLLEMGGLKSFSHVDLRRFGNVIDPIYDGRFSANIILRAADGAIGAGGGTWLTKEEMQEWKEEFSYCFAKLVDAKGGPSEVRKAAIGAFGAAFVIGAASGETERSAAMFAELKKGLTRPAIAARRAVAVQEIIDAEAASYWARTPGRRGQLRATARKIWPAVKARLLKESNIPAEWRPLDPCNDETFIERIRTRLRRRTNVTRPRK